MKSIFRFVGDPVGYVTQEFVYDYLLRENKPHWVEAFVGTTDKEVLIDVSKAYIREIG